VPRFVVRGVDIAAGGLTAPMPGAIIDVRVTLGQHVDAGETLVVMEAMKMEHVITAPTTGTVTAIFVSTGQQVDNGAVLLTLEDDDHHHEEGS
jgi:biotin carboxyl carrier protein